jgi:hypothetical protein
VHVPKHVRRASQQTNNVEKFEANVLEKSPLHRNIGKYIRERARAEYTKGHEAADRRNYLRKWDATIEDNRLPAQKSQDTKDDKALKLSKISFLDINNTTFEALYGLLVPALDEQINKIRAVSAEYIAAKTSFKGTMDGKKPKHRKIDVILSAFKLLKELPEFCDGKIVEDGLIKLPEEDAELDDVEMAFQDEIS